MAMTADQKKRLDEALERFKLSCDAYSAQTQRELAAKRFEALDQWPEWVKIQRAGNPPGTPGAIAARPCLTISQLEQPLAQVQNAQKAARLSIKVTPKGDGASKDTANIFQGLIRNIEVESRAQLARDWAFRDATICGRGFYRIYCEDADNGSYNDQDICIKRILNSNSVYLDPYAQEPDWSDMEYALVTDDMPMVSFRAEYPKSRIAKMDDRALRDLASSSSSLTSQGDTIPGWVNATATGWSVRVAEYWYVSYENREKVLFTTPTGTDWAWADELPDGFKQEAITERRQVPQRKVDCCLITGTEILEETEWDGKYIPIVPVIGKEHNVGGRRMWDGVVNESAQDAQRIINYMNSAQVEAVGIGTKAPYVLDPKQIEGFEQEWNQSNTRNLPYLKRHSFNAQGQPFPPIERNEAEPPIQSITIALNQAMSNLQHVTGIPAVSLGQIEPAHRSGEAINALKQSVELGTSGYVDNLSQMSLTLEGKILVDLIPKKYDRPGRIVKVLMLDDKPSNVILNAPFVKGPNGEPEAFDPARHAQEQQVHYAMQTGQYSIAVDVGKHYTTRQQETNAGLVSIMEAYPPSAPVIAPQFVRNMDFPGSSETSDMLRAMIPPQLQMALAASENQAIPPPIQMMLKQLQMENQQLKQAIETKQIEQQADLQKADIDGKYRVEVAKVNQSGALMIADLKATTDQIIASAKASAEQLRTLTEAVQEMRLAHHQAAHEAATQHVAHGHETRLAHMNNQAAQELAAQQAENSNAQVSGESA